MLTQRLLMSQVIIANGGGWICRKALLLESGEQNAPAGKGRPADHRQIGLSAACEGILPGWAHERRQMTYLEMSTRLTQSGIAKWTVDTGRMTVTFCDKAGGEMLVEPIS
jgi:hypothetical protein